MTIYTNRRLVVGVVCFLMNLSGLAAAQAPQTPEAFYELVEGRQMDVIFDELLPILFIAPGRHSTRLERNFNEGNYDYESTRAATGTLVLKFDFDNNTQPVLEIELTFESRTAGTVLATIFREDGTVEEENLPGTFEIVNAIVPEQTAAGDRAALMALYDATNGASWGDSTNWGSSRPLGEWHGVTTDPYGNVTELGLHTNGLTGEIPAALGSMTNLTELWLSYNDLTGEIPAALGSLTNLTVLDLSFNGRLTGEIPAALGSMTNLRTLDLFRNELTGEIPAALGSLTNLRSMGLGENRLTGEIPAALGSMTNLRTLNLFRNELTGEIPAALGSSTSLEYLDLRDNRLTGEIPAALARFENTINPQQGGVYLPVASTPVPALPLAGLFLLGALGTLAGISLRRRGGSFARGPSHQHRR